MLKTTDNIYSEDFRVSSAKLAYESDKPITHIAKELGLKKSTLFTWVNKYYPNKKALECSDKDSEVDVDLLAENKRLKKELLRAQQERDILKKATAYFANETL